MTANIDAMVRSGIEAYKRGDKDEARTLLEKAVELDSYHEDAWMWLSAVVDTVDEQKTCLENVLVINPDNERAKAGLQSLGVDPDQLIDASASPPPPAPEPEPPPVDDRFAVETGSMEWGTGEAEPPPPVESPRRPRGEELSSADYDSWIDSLNLASDEADSAEAEETSDAYDDVLDSITQGASTFDEDTGQDMRAALFGDDDFDDVGQGAFTSSPFDENVMDEEPAQDFTTGIFDDDDFGDAFTDGPFSASTPVFDEPEPEPEPSPTPPPPEPTREPIMSPGMENVDETGKFLEDLDTSDYTEADYAADPAAYFELIPKDIKATRLPGTSEKYPMPVLAATIILVVLNFGALILLILNLFA